MELLYIGSNRPEDRKLVESAGLNFRSIRSGKLRRYPSWENLWDLFRFWWGIWDAGRIIKKFQPDVVFTKGGYVSLPVVVAAKKQNIPVVVHESDSQLGLANRLALKSAEKLAVAWPIQTYWQTAAKLSRYADKFVFTGLPVARELLEWRAGKLFENDLPIVLVTGGSQGAKSLNEAVWATLPALLRQANVVHQAGSLDIEQAEAIKRDLAPELQPRYLPFGFDRNIFLSALHTAEIVISRSGSFVFELAALGKPAILVPLMGSANDHQRKNAEALVKLGAAIMIAPEILNGEVLNNTVKDLLMDEARRQTLSRNLSEWGEASRQAASTIAKLILDVSKK